MQKKKIKCSQIFNCCSKSNLKVKTPQSLLKVFSKLENSFLITKKKCFRKQLANRDHESLPCMISHTRK